MDKDKFLANLMREAEENPVLAMGAAAALFGAASKLVNSLAWRKEVNRRVRMAQKKK